MLDKFLEGASIKSIDWQIATITHIKRETPRTSTFTLALPNWQEFRAGQHFDVRLTAEDGYQVERSYSIASAPEQKGSIDLTVEKLDDGEVSPYLHDIVVVGDQIEVRGPIGGYFVWEATLPEPLLLIGGGSGVVPLMSILRHRAAAGATNPTRLLYSARSLEDVIYRDELEAMRQQPNGPEVIYTLTRSRPPGWTGYARRIDAAMVREVAAPLGGAVRVYICGPTTLVENAANLMVALGVTPAAIKTERFGPSGNQ
jgi:ferredoxin-NADP reductase